MKNDLVRQSQDAYHNLYQDGYGFVRSMQIFVDKTKCSGLPSDPSDLIYLLQEPAGRRIQSRKLSGDIDALKRPMSAFLLWLNDNRQRIRDENPDLSVVNITRIAGEEWWAVKDRSVSLASII